MNKIRRWWLNLTFGERDCPSCDAVDGLYLVEYNGRPAKRCANCQLIFSWSDR